MAPLQGSNAASRSKARLCHIAYQILYKGSNMSKSLFIFITVLALSSTAQDRKFPVSANDNLVYFNILGSGTVLMSVNTILAKIDNTYTPDRNMVKAREGIIFCATDANISFDANVVTGVKVLMSSSGLIKLFLTISNKDVVISATDIVQRRSLLATSD